MTTARKLFFIALLLLLLAACGRDKAEEPAAAAPEATLAPASGPTAAPALPADATAAPAAAQVVGLSDDPLEAVTNAMRSQMSGGPYRAQTSVTADGTTTDMTSEIIPPDKMHIVIGGGNMELILLDGTLWSKSGETPWAQMGSPEMMQGIFDSIQGQIEGATLTNVQLVGAEPVLGEATQVYSYTSTIGEGEGVVTSDVKLWISKASGLPVRMEATGTAMGSTSHTLQSIEYDNSITIEAPTP
jgi:hypothetical protein